MNSSYRAANETNLLIVGQIYDQSLEKLLLSISKIGAPNSTNTVQLNIVSGMSRILGKDSVSVLSTAITGLFPHNCSRVLIRSQKLQLSSEVNGFFTGYINLPFIKEIICTIRILLRTVKWIFNQRKSGKSCAILTYNLYTPMLVAIVLAKMIFPKQKTMLVLGDLAGDYIASSGRSAVFRWVEKWDYSIQLRLANRFDAYGLCTKWMLEAIDCKNKPYCIVEVIVDNKDYPKMKVTSADKKRSIIMHAGTLKREYNLQLLLDAFTTIGCDDSELWIFGSGDMEEEIIEKSNKDNRIKFFGYIPKNRLIEMQSKADLFVNPRTPTGAFTKYSFPSKTAEIMLAERPLVCYKLDGIPDEYDDYLFYVDEETSTSLADTIQEVLTKSKAELRTHCIQAKEFIIQNKSATVQCRRLLETLGKKLEGA